MLHPIRHQSSHLLFLLFDYSRNGLFFAPLFLLLGGALAARPPRHTRRWYGCAFALCLLLLCGEALLVRRLELARHVSMYLLLPLCLWTLVRLLCDFPSAPRPPVLLPRGRAQPFRAARPRKAPASLRGPLAFYLFLCLDQRTSCIKHTCCHGSRQDKT